MFCKVLRKHNVLALMIEEVSKMKIKVSTQYKCVSIYLLY